MVWHYANWRLMPEGVAHQSLVLLVFDHLYLVVPATDVLRDRTVTTPDRFGMNPGITA